MPRDADGMPCMIQSGQGNAWGWALMRKECFARSAVRRLMPCQNRFGAADREWADRMVTF